MKEFNVMFQRYGFATIEAESEAEAKEIANNMKANEIQWSDDFDFSDIIDED